MFQKLNTDTPVGTIYTQTLDYYGSVLQYMTAIEEMAEVEQLMSKVFRYPNLLESPPEGAGSHSDFVEELFGEVGDAINMIEQVMFLHGSLDMAQDLMDQGHTDYANFHHIAAETVRRISQLKIELAGAITMIECGMNCGVDGSELTVYSGDVLRMFRDLMEHLDYPEEKLAEKRIQKLDRILKRMERD